MNHLLLTHALSPLHAGTGQGVGVIDLPIAREAATGLPCVPGSGLKGSLRDRCSRDGVRRALFGPDQTAAHEHAGSVVFSDQRLLLLPVRSLFGVFAWATCPLILQRFARDIAEVGGQALPKLPEAPLLTDQAASARITMTSALEGQLGGAPPRSAICLEDLDLNPLKDGHLTKLSAWLGARLFPDEPEEGTWRTMLSSRICLLPDDVFAFLLDTATEVVARIRLDDDSKTVARGQLWYEESLPAESVLYGLVAELPNTRALSHLDGASITAELRTLCSAPVQLGGKANVGRGLCQLRLTTGA